MKAGSNTQSRQERQRHAAIAKQPISKATAHLDGARIEPHRQRQR